jgi:hypothetical protein
MSENGESISWDFQEDHEAGDQSTVRSTTGLQKMNDLTLWRGQSLRKEKDTTSCIRDRYMRAPATPGSVAHTDHIQEKQLENGTLGEFCIL